MTQKDAVFSVVTSVIEDAGFNFEVGKDDASSLLTKTLRTQINSELVRMFDNSEVDLSDEARSKLNDAASLRSYVSGLVSNWLRKDARLNGGTTTGKSISVDPQLRALRKLQSSQTDPSRRLEIQKFIDKRTAELSA